MPHARTLGEDLLLEMVVRLCLPLLLPPIPPLPPLRAAALVHLLGASAVHDPEADHLGDLGRVRVRVRARVRVRVTVRVRVWVRVWVRFRVRVRVTKAGVRGRFWFLAVLRRVRVQG